MSKKATDIVSYIGPIGWLISFFAGTKDASKFHLNQSLVIWVFEIIVSLVQNLLKGIPVLGVIISLVCGIAAVALFVFWIMGLISACQGTEKEVPLIGGIRFLK